jgi:hypothetical protein
MHNPLANYSGVQTRVGMTESEAADLKHLGLALPDSLLALLRSSNGLSAFDGYFRVFSFGRGTPNDAVQWNNFEFWKFAWKGRCDDFWCFGCTAWGDQYAFRFDHLRRRKAAVFFLDSLAMTPEEIAPDFDTFFQKEFLRNAARPYDSMTLKAQEKFGALGDDALLVYSVSPLLGGEEHIANVQKMPRQTAMIFNGDVATQLDDGPEGGEIAGVEPYQDSRDRSRLRLVWKLNRTGQP